MRYHIAAPVLVCLCFSTSAGALDTPDKLEQNHFGETATGHPEYRECLTHWVDACGAWNKDYVKPEPHEPSLEVTLDWIGDQLSRRGFAHQFRHDGCIMSIDTMEGSPLSLGWRETADDKGKFKRRSILSPALAGQTEAWELQGSGYVTYLAEDHRNNGTSVQPRNLTYYNDAAVIDLSRLREIKNYVGTAEDGSRFLVGGPGSTIKINIDYDAFPSVSQVGAELTDSPESALMPLEGSDDIKQLYGRTYVTFETKNPSPQFILLLPSDDIPFNLKITRAFLHAISLCEAASNTSDKE